MLIGKYYHLLESEGRLSLPKKFRSDQEKWIITRGLDGCLFLLKPDRFTEELAKITDYSFNKKANRDLLRLMTNEAAEINSDKLGRIKIPAYLIKYARLKKNLVVVGSYQRVEIWDQDLYHQYIDQLEKTAEDIAENID